MPSRSIFSCIFNIRMWSSIFDPPGLSSALYSTSEFRALYLALQVYIQFYIHHPNVELYFIFGPPVLYSDYIQHLNVELYIRPWRSIFNIQLLNNYTSCSGSSWNLVIKCSNIDILNSYFEILQVDIIELAPNS